jgi:hypothetical protein
MYLHTRYVHMAVEDRISLEMFSGVVPNDIKMSLIQYECQLAVFDFGSYFPTDGFLNILCVEC